MPQIRKRSASRCVAGRRSRAASVHRQRRRHCRNRKVVSQSYRNAQSTESGLKIPFTMGLFYAGEKTRGLRLAFAFISKHRGILMP